MEKTELKHYLCPVKGCAGELFWEVDQWVCPDCQAVLCEGLDKIIDDDE